MKNAFARIGWTCVSMMTAAALSAGGAMAAQISPVSIAIPHSIAVGSTTLPSGNYTISGIELADGDQLFVIRPEHGSPITVQARRIPGETADDTKVKFSTDGDQWRLQKLFISGDSNGYEFLDSGVAGSK